MFIEAVPNRKSPPAILLRESYREGKRVRKRTLANLSKWPPHLVEGFRTLLKGGTALARLEDSFEVDRSLPHGHVAAVLGMIRKLGLDRLIGPDCPERDRVLGMVAARIVHPGSKLGTVRGWAKASARDSLGETLGIDDSDENDLYAAMDWLAKRQEPIERRLAERHLRDGSLVLYDLTSVYLEGRRCSLAARGHSRDGKRGKLQIEFGLLCDADGCPVAVEVFRGNTADPATVGSQIDRLKKRFGLQRVILVGDRGMLTEARIRDELKPSGLDWISALRGPAIRKLVESGAVQTSLFDEQDLVEIRSDRYPGERLMVCRNPLLAEQRARKRTELLEATEQLLDQVVAATRREKRPLKGIEAISLRVGKVIGKYKMAKHFDLKITEEGFDYHRREDAIAGEAALDGLYVVRTNLSEAVMDAPSTVRSYKRLCRVERAFRSLKTVDLKVRPVFHYDSDRVRAHVFVCMLAYYVEWHMRRCLAPLLFDDDDPDAARSDSVVAPARVSPSALDKASRKVNDEGLPVHSFQTLLADLATISRNRIVPRLPGAEPFETLTRPTALQTRAFELLNIRLKCTQ